MAQKIMLSLAVFFCWTFALKAEENAYQLYKAAAGMTEDPKLQKTLLTFAEVELNHRRKIEALYDEKVLTEG